MVFLGLVAQSSKLSLCNTGTDFQMHNWKGSWLTPALEPLTVPYYPYSQVVQTSQWPKGLPTFGLHISILCFLHTHFPSTLNHTNLLRVPGFLVLMILYILFFVGIPFFLCIHSGSLYLFFSHQASISSSENSSLFHTVLAKNSERFTLRSSCLHSFPSTKLREAAAICLNVSVTLVSK